MTRLHEAYRPQALGGDPLGVDQGRHVGAVGPHQLGGQRHGDAVLVAEGERSQRYVDFIDAEKTRKATVSVVSDIPPEFKKKMIAIIASAEKK